MAGDPGVLAAFGGGVISFLSPCVLPLVPGYLSLISGVSVGELEESETSTTRVQTAIRVVRPTLLFIAGFTVVFTALGASASALGEVLRDHQRELNRVAGVAIVVMGLFLAGVVSPRILLAERRLHVAPSQLGGWAPPVMGMAFAFGWSPCIGPILGGVLGLASNEDTLARGALLLVAYSLGLGVPFLITGVAMGRLAGVFGAVKRHSRTINLVAGLALIAFGVLLFTDRVFWLSLRIQSLMEDLHLEFLSEI